MSFGMLVYSKLQFSICLIKYPTSVVTRSQKTRCHYSQGSRFWRGDSSHPPYLGIWRARAASIRGAREASQAWQVALWAASSLCEGNNDCHCSFLPFVTPEQGVSPCVHVINKTSWLHGLVASFGLPSGACLAALFALPWSSSTGYALSISFTEMSLFS